MEKGASKSQDSDGEELTGSQDLSEVMVWGLQEQGSKVQGLIETLLSLVNPGQE